MEPSTPRQWSPLKIVSESVTGICKKKVKVTLVQALRLCTDRTAHKGSRGTALPFHDHGTRRGWGVSVTPRLLFTPAKDLVPIVQEAGWAPGPVWTGAENLAPTGIRSPDRPPRSQSLYRLRYPALGFVCRDKDSESPKCPTAFHWHAESRNTLHLVVLKASNVVCFEL